MLEVAAANTPSASLPWYGRHSSGEDEPIHQQGTQRRAGGDRAGQEGGLYTIDLVVGEKPQKEWREGSQELQAE